MIARQVEILFISGSPRSHSSEALLALLERGVRDVGARSRRFLLSKKHIAPCIGCGTCRKTGTCIQADSKSAKWVNDDYPEFIDALSRADALAVISPLYFAGPPSQLKALYDRMQPLWSRRYSLRQDLPIKRSAQLFVLGSGLAHGYDPLVLISRSALAVAGFSLEKVQNFIGFKHPNDVPPPPEEDEEPAMAKGDLARLCKEAAVQKEFEERALIAGRAFARHVKRKKNEKAVKTKAQDELLSKRVPDKGEIGIETPLLFSDDNKHDSSVANTIRVDSDFELLKRAVWATKSSGSKQQETETKTIETVTSPLTQNDDSLDDVKTKPTMAVGSNNVEPVPVKACEPEDDSADIEDTCSTLKNSTSSLTE